MAKISNESRENYEKKIKPYQDELKNSLEKEKKIQQLRLCIYMKLKKKLILV